MAKFVAVFEVEDLSGDIIDRDTQKTDIMVAIRDALLDNNLVGIGGKQYKVVTVPEVYFSF